MFAFDGTTCFTSDDVCAVVETLSIRQIEAFNARAESDIPPATAQPNVPKISDAATFLYMLPQRLEALSGLETYAHDDWDCEGAIALSADVINWSRVLLLSLYPLVPNPEVAPAADGSLCMEWAQGNNLIWADIEPSGKLRTLEKIDGKKLESSFDIYDGKSSAYLATAFARLYA